MEWRSGPISGSSRASSLYVPAHLSASLLRLLSPGSPGLTAHAHPGPTGRPTCAPRSHNIAIYSIGVLPAGLRWSCSTALLPSGRGFPHTFARLLTRLQLATPPRHHTGHSRRLLDPPVRWTPLSARLDSRASLLLLLSVCPPPLHVCLSSAFIDLIDLCYRPPSPTLTGVLNDTRAQ